MTATPWSDAVPTCVLANGNVASPFASVVPDRVCASGPVTTSWTGMAVIGVPAMSCSESFIVCCPPVCDGGSPAGESQNWGGPIGAPPHVDGTPQSTNADPSTAFVGRNGLMTIAPFTDVIAPTPTFA